MGRTRGIVIGEEVENSSKLKSQNAKVVEKKEKKEKEPKAELHVEPVLDDQSDTVLERDTLKESVESPADEKPLEKKVVKRVTHNSKKKRSHSSHYMSARNVIDANKKYSVSDALELLKKTSYTKFDSTVEIHVRTIAKKGQDPLRGLVSLPSGAPKQKKIVVADDALIETIKSGKINFDILLAMPAMMPKLALVAKILGPKGLMPSPKSGTVVDDPKTALQELSSGKVEYKTDSLGNIHLGIGKVSWDSAQLIANVDVFLKVIPVNRIGSTALCSTMGPSIKIK